MDGSYRCCGRFVESALRLAELRGGRPDRSGDWCRRCHCVRLPQSRFPRRETIAPIHARATICTVLHTAYIPCSQTSALGCTPHIPELMMFQPGVGTPRSADVGQPTLLKDILSQLSNSI